VLLGRDELLVGLGVHQLLEVGNARLVDLDLGDPAAAVRVVLGDLVDGAGLLLEQHVGRGDAAADGGVDVGGALDRLDGADGVAGLDLLALLGELDEDDVAEGLGGVLADANDAGLLIGREIDPFVLLGVFPQRICERGSVEVLVSPVTGGGFRFGSGAVWCETGGGRTDWLR